MTTAIIYTTTHGTTEKVAQKISQHLGEDCTVLINLKEQPKPDMSVYDIIILGGSIHAGSLQKRLKDFCKNNTLTLLEKPLGLFLCGMNEPEYDQQLEKAFPEILRHHARLCDTLGGEFLFEKMNFFQRVIVQKVSGIQQTVSKLNEEKILDFAKKMRAI